jgi:Tfp pilus assembly protein PilN
MYFTVNLLPPQKQQALRTGLVIAYAESVLLFFLALAVLFAVTLVSLRFVLAGVEKDVLGRSEELTTESKSPRAEIKDLDLYLKRVADLHEGTVRWSDVLQDVAQAAPAGVVLEDISITDKGTAIMIRGVAPTRDGVLAYREGLQRTGRFNDLSSPISNILQKTDVSFVFEARIGEADAEAEPERP